MPICIGNKKWSYTIQRSVHVCIGNSKTRFSTYKKIKKQFRVPCGEVIVRKVRIRLLPGNLSSGVLGT